MVTADSQRLRHSAVSSPETTPIRQAELSALLDLWLDRKRGLPAVVALTREKAPAWLAEAYAGNVPMDPGEVESRVRADWAAALEALSLAGASEPARHDLASLTRTLQ